VGKSGVLEQKNVNISETRKNREQEAQLPQRNSASAVHVYLGWVTDHAMHRTPQNRRGCIIFLHSNTLIQEVLDKNGF